MGVSHKIAFRCDGLAYRCHSSPTDPLFRPAGICKMCWGFFNTSGIGPPEVVLKAIRDFACDHQDTTTDWRVGFPFETTCLSSRVWHSPILGVVPFGFLFSSHSHPFGAATTTLTHIASASFALQTDPSNPYCWVD